MYSLQATWTFQTFDISILSKTPTRQKSYYEHCTNDVRSVTSKARTVTSMVRQVPDAMWIITNNVRTVTNIVRMVTEVVEDTLNIAQKVKTELASTFCPVANIMQKILTIHRLNWNLVKNVA